MAKAKAALKASVPEPHATAAPPRGRGGIPNGLTLLSLALGFLATLAAGKGGVDESLSLLALAALVDTLAGSAAQGLRQATPIGAELDSLASLVVWGLAAALLAFAQSLEGLGWEGMALAGLVTVTAAWRLCRGDGQNARERFEGLPLPVAGAILVAALALGIPVWGLVALVFLLAWAQLGSWTYPRVRPRLIWFAPIFFSLILAALGWRPGWVLPGLVAAGYALGAPYFDRDGALRA